MARLRLNILCNPLCFIGVPAGLALLLSACNASSHGKFPITHTFNAVSGTVQLSPLKTTQILVSRLQPEKSVCIFSQEEGRIMSLPFHERHAVKVEENIVHIDDTLPKKSINRAEARAETALIQARAEQEMLETRLHHTAIMASFSGVLTVTQAFVGEGNVAERHSHWLTLMDVSQPRIEVILDQVPQGALCGQLCQVRITSEIIERLNIPTLALHHDSLGDFVYRINGNNTVNQLQVKAGIQAGRRPDILHRLLRVNSS